MRDCLLMMYLSLLHILYRELSNSSKYSGLDDLFISLNKGNNGSRIRTGALMKDLLVMYIPHMQRCEIKSNLSKYSDLVYVTR